MRLGFRSSGRGKNSALYRLRIPLLLLAVAALLAGAYFGAEYIENRGKKPEPRGDYNLRHAYDVTIQRGDVTYRQKRNLTTILIMGIDRDSDAEEPFGFRNGGRADFLRLVVIDGAAQTVSQLAIDRDTMTPITVLGVLGNRSGTRTQQISLAHNFGDGKEQSCELTVEAVSNLLFGTPIDFYIAVSMDGIAALNDAVGGVTVTLEDDFSHLDPAMTKGTTLTLNGTQAEYFVRGRMSMSVGTNEARMARQQQYLSQVMTALARGQEKDENFAGTLFDALSPYLVTNLSRGRLINEAYAARNYEHPALYEIEGTHSIGWAGDMEFRADEESLEEVTLSLFYDKVN